MIEEQIAALLAENEALRKQLSDKDAEIASRDAKIASLQDALLYLRKKVFGKMSEKHLPLDPAQLNLFEQYEMTEEEKAQLARDVENAEKTITYSVTRQAKPSRKPLDDGKLPVKEIHIYPEGTTNALTSIIISVFILIMVRNTQ